MSIIVLLNGGNSRPPAPSRADAIRIVDSFQGLMIQSKTYGPLPWFAAALGAMDRVGELDSVLDQVIAAGDTHCQVDLVFNYGERGQPWGTPQLVPDCDLSGDMPTYLRICDRVIQRGLKPIFVVPAEGQDGLNWIYAKFHEFVNALRTGYDRAVYGPVQLGYDGTWPASWSVQQVKDVLVYCRQFLGSQGILAMMFANGPEGGPYLYVEDEQDYSKPWMQCLDIVMVSTGPDQAQCPSLVNNATYMIENLTPHDVCTPGHVAPFWLMKPGTPRGPYGWSWREWNEYNFVRQGLALVAAIAADKARVLSVNIQSHG